LTALLFDNYKQSLEAARATIVLASSLAQVCRLNFIKNYITTRNLEGTLDQQKEYCSKYFDIIDPMDDDLQSELQTVTAERDSARRDLLAFQQQAATLSSQRTQALAEVVTTTKEKISLMFCCLMVLNHRKSAHGSLNFVSSWPLSSAVIPPSKRSYDTPLVAFPMLHLTDQSPSQVIFG
jgi:hypothetical protein